jgi:hypothetical protein
MAKNANAEARRKAQFYARQDVQQSVVCGRLFVRRKDRICSIACAERAQKLDADAKQAKCT